MSKQVKNVDSSKYDSQGYSKSLSDRIDYHVKTVVARIEQQKKILDAIGQSESLPTFAYVTCVDYYHIGTLVGLTRHEGYHYWDKQGQKDGKEPLNLTCDGLIALVWDRMKLPTLTHSETPTA